jgi:hypothetical protein
LTGRGFIMERKLNARSKKTAIRKKCRGSRIKENEIKPLPVEITKGIVRKSNVIKEIVGDKQMMVSEDNYLCRSIYGFGNKDLIKMFKYNQSFREALMSGAYFYYQGRICLYHPDVFAGDENGIKIADIVNKNPDNYLLSRYTNSSAHQCGRHSNRETHKVLYKLRNTRASDKDALYKSQYKHAKMYLPIEDDEDEQRSEAFMYTLELVKKFINGGQGGGTNFTFGEYFTYLMSERKLTIRQLADMTDIPERTISRMRSEDGYKPSIEYLIACCIVMKLLPWESDLLFELAGIVLRTNNKTERCYIVLLHMFFKEGSVEVCDAVLSTMELPTLSSIIESNKKSK